MTKEFTWTPVRLNNVILSYPSLFEPDEFGEQRNYKTDCLISKKDPQFKELMSVIFKTLKEDVGLTWDQLKHKPVKDFDHEAAERPELAGYAVVRAKSKADKKRPPVVDVKLLPIADESEIYGGVVANVHITAGCYDNKFGKGITLILNAVQKVKDGEYLGGSGGRQTPEDMFEVIGETADVGTGGDDEFEL